MTKEARLLPLNKAEEISTSVLDLLSGQYEPEEIIPGLILAVSLCAEDTVDAHWALAEADELLIDGFPEEI